MVKSMKAGSRSSKVIPKKTAKGMKTGPVKEKGRPAQLSKGRSGGSASSKRSTVTRSAQAMKVLKRKANLAKAMKSSAAKPRLAMAAPKAMKAMRSIKPTAAEKGKRSMSPKPMKAASKTNLAATCVQSTAQTSKTKICTFWRDGKCRRGDACQFAHGAEEQLQSCRRVLCRYHTGANFPATCKYAHVEVTTARDEPWTFSKRSVGFVHTLPSQNPSMDENGKANGGVSAQQQKTLACKFWLEGKCLRGEQCAFAHSAEEQRLACKLVMCRFERDGYCRQGSECWFAHSEDERLANSAEAVKMDPPPGLAPPPDVAPPPGLAGFGVRYTSADLCEPPPCPPFPLYAAESGIPLPER
eukprot:TRINITY_DN59788_c0_g1_i1.p1 TRINITY_DN59788_c0_g1~~TRINITY_DN59788_c0_g1_i1.p1  ORF type:complete len:356 (-),score=46.79 TRINITY_DN59788_c0_g1_i1:247-1314(-)